MTRDDIDFYCHVGALAASSLVLVAWGYMSWAVELVRR